ncbi:MAG: hypothetical protein ACJKSS_01935 [Patescibacteria group bacterium UBA2103]
MNLVKDNNLLYAAHVLFLALVLIFFKDLPYLFINYSDLILQLIVSILIAITFYQLGKEPERRHRQTLRKNLKKHYGKFREDLTRILLGTQEELINAERIEETSKRDNFRRFFKEELNTGETRWDRVRNKMEADDGEVFVRQILIELLVFRDFMSVVFNTLEVKDERLYNVYSGLSRMIYSIENMEVTARDNRMLSSFLWEIGTGFSFVEGYPEEDIIEKLIKEI